MRRAVWLRHLWQCAHVNLCSRCSIGKVAVLLCANQAVASATAGCIHMQCICTQTWEKVLVARIWDSECSQSLLPLYGHSRGKAVAVMDSDPVTCCCLQQLSSSTEWVLPHSHCQSRRFFLPLAGWTFDSDSGKGAAFYPLLSCFI